MSTLSDSLKPGDYGPAVVQLQNRLRKLGYWLGDVDGRYGPLAEQAVMAMQKVEGLSPDGAAGPATLAVLAVARRPSSSASGDLIEVDRSREVLFIVRAGVVAWTINTSTGVDRPDQAVGDATVVDPAMGHWHVAWAVDGDALEIIGAFSRPRYFQPGGIAVHGYRAAPLCPASDDCVRVSEAAMDWSWANDLMPIDSVEWVHA